MKSKRKTPLEKAAKELDNIKTLLTMFEQKRTVLQHEKWAFRIMVRIAWFENYLADHVDAVRKTHAQRKHT